MVKIQEQPSKTFSAKLLGVYFLPISSESFTHAQVNAVKPSISAVDSLKQRESKTVATDVSTESVKEPPKNIPSATLPQPTSQYSKSTTRPFIVGEDSSSHVKHTSPSSATPLLPAAVAHLESLVRFARASASRAPFDRFVTLRRTVEAVVADGIRCQPASPWKAALRLPWRLMPEPKHEGFNRHPWIASKKGSNFARRLSQRFRSDRQPADPLQSPVPAKGSFTFEIDCNHIHLVHRDSKHPKIICVVSSLESESGDCRCHIFKAPSDDQAGKIAEFLEGEKKESHGSPDESEDISKDVLKDFPKIFHDSLDEINQCLQHLIPDTEEIRPIAENNLETLEPIVDSSSSEKLTGITAESAVKELKDVIAAEKAVEELVESRTDCKQVVVGGSVLFITDQEDSRVQQLVECVGQLQQQLKQETEKRSGLERELGCLTSKLAIWEEEIDSVRRGLYDLTRCLGSGESYPHELLQSSEGIETDETLGSPDSGVCCDFKEDEVCEVYQENTIPDDQDNSTDSDLLNSLKVPNAVNLHYSSLEPDSLVMSIDEYLGFGSNLEEAYKNSTNNKRFNFYEAKLFCQDLIIQHAF